MLSQNQVVAVRKAIESTYTGKCTVTVQEEYTKANKSIGFREKDILVDQSCKLSFEKITSTQNVSNASKLIQTAKILIAPEIQIEPGSKLTVTQNGLTTEYKKSGEPAVYDTHQEIILELFDGWA